MAILKDVIPIYLTEPTPNELEKEINNVIVKLKFKGQREAIKQFPALSELFGILRDYRRNEEED